MMKHKFFLGCVFLATTILTVRSDIIPTLDSVTPVGGNFRWDYTTNVTVDQIVESGDYFTIYDFGNLLPGSNVQPADWSFISLLIGTTPATVLPEDDPAIFNLTWTYNGSMPISGSSFLGTFSVLSTTNQLRSDYFTAHATRSSGPTAGSKIDNIGFVNVPVPEMSALSPIIGLCGLGAIGYFSSILRRRVR